MTTSYLEIPEELRRADQTLRTIKQILSRLPIKYLLRDPEGASDLLQEAISTTQDLTKLLQSAQDRVTR